MILDKEHSDILVYPFITAIDGRVKQVSDRFAQLTGYQKEELADITLQELAALLRLDIDISNIIFEPELFIFTKTLEARNVQIIKGDSSTDGIIYYFGERPHTRLDEKFCAIEQLQQDNIMGVAIFAMPDIKLLKANKTWLDFLDKPYNQYENAIGRKISEIITGWKGSTSEQIWKDMMESGKAFRNNEYRYDKFERGITYWDASITPVKEDGLIKYAIEITTDITEKVAQKKTLEEQAAIILNQNEHMKAILDNMTEAIFIVDRERNIVQYNKSAKHFFYESKVDRKIGDSLSHTTYYDINGNEIEIEHMPAIKILNGETAKPIRMTVKRPDGILHYNVSGSPIHDDKGNIIEALVCCNDITEHILREEAERAHQKAMIEAEKREKNNLQEVLRLKDEFLYFMSHEFKTPLTVINAAIQALEHIYKNQMPDSAFGMVKKIKQNSFRQLRIVNNILDITRLNAGVIKTNKTNMDIVLLTRAIIESVLLFAEQKGVKIVFESSIEQRVIGIDEEKFERILLNLLSNAIKFTPKDKMIFVRLSIEKQGRKEMVCIAVEDQGIGIPENKREVVFERFGQVDEALCKQAEGTGIGLYLVKLFIEHMGGTIKLKSEVAAGSTFTIQLPANKENNVEEGIASMDSQSKLIEATAIEFSDIYL